MQELIKSLISFSWSISLFGLKEAAKLLSPAGPGEVVREADSIFTLTSQAASQTLGPSLQKTYDYGDQIQRRLVDAGFGLLKTNQAIGATLTNPSQILNPLQYLRIGFAFLQGGIKLLTGANKAQTGGPPTGWGPVNPPSPDGQ